MPKLKNLKFTPPVPTALSIGQKNDVRSLLSRLQSLAEEKRGIADDEKALLAQLKEKGFPSKAVREALKHAALSQFKREDHERAVDLLKDALGLLADTPLGEAALKREATKSDQVDLEELTEKAAAAGVTVSEDGDLVIPTKAKRGRPPGPKKANRVPRLKPAPKASGAQPSAGLPKQPPF